jgi:hypothetical protein
MEVPSDGEAEEEGPEGGGEEDEDEDEGRKTWETSLRFW